MTSLEEAVLYSRGFLFTRRESSDGIPGWFERRALPDGHTFHHHPELALALAEDAERGSWLLVAGFAVDVESGASDIRSIAHQLLVQREAGESRFFDALDRLSGRFVAIVHAGGATRVLHDACGMKAVFYDAGFACVASHADLTARFAGARERSSWKELEAAGMLRRGSVGLETPFEGIRFLTPNTLLDWTAKRVERYFPRDDLEPTTLDRAADVITQAARVQVRAIFERGASVLCGLTGGLDSRMTLALAGSARTRMRFMTYRSEKPDAMADADCAERITRTLALEHDVFDVRTPAADDAPDDYDRFAAVFKRNSFYRRRPRVAYQFFRRYRSKFDVLLKSHVAEIGRAPSWYHHRHGVERIESGRDLTIVHAGRKARRNAAVRVAFDDFFARTRFDRNRNYDRFDLFYWEHRMGTWGSLVAMEGDPAFDTHILFNSRTVLNAMLALPLEARRSAALFHRAIGQALPELREVPYA